MFDFHQEIDALLEQEKAKAMLGTTKKGIGPTYAAKVGQPGRDGGITRSSSVSYKQPEDGLCYITNNLLLWVAYYVAMEWPETEAWLWSILKAQ